MLIGKEYSWDDFVDDDFENYEAYEHYLESITDLLPQKFLKYYNEKYTGMGPNRFHDCSIKELSLLGDAYYYRNEKDKIRLVLKLSRTIEYDMEFSDIDMLKIDYLKDEDWLSENGLILMGTILPSFIRLLPNQKYEFKFYTTTNFRFTIQFGKVKIKKRKLY